MGKALYYKPTRDQDETGTFVFVGFTQNLRQFIFMRVTYVTFGTPYYTNNGEN